jgi:cell division septation protein DedD
MARNDDGEFELVLGNRQLLSVFFLVVILFAVVFTMGYIVGRNSISAAGATASQKAPAAEPIAPAVVIPRAESKAAPAERQAEAAEAPQGTQPAPGAADPPAAEPPKAAAAIAEPAPGQMYLQVSAVKQPEAEVIAESLKKKGFAAILGPGPKDSELVRVLVGPLKDGDTLARTKSELEAAGFRNPIVRK